VEGFIEAYGDPGVPESWRETVFRVIRQRLAAHEHPEAVADAMQAAPRSQPFARLDDLGGIDVPTVVVADRDEADPGHPLAIGKAYAEAIPGADLRVEEEGKSPLAWQGSQLSKIIAEVAEKGG
jgi:pimeloyl-ACP methyl ester carboxylesterase